MMGGEGLNTSGRFSGCRVSRWLVERDIHLLNYFGTIKIRRLINQ